MVAFFSALMRESAAFKSSSETPASRTRHSQHRHADFFAMMFRRT